MISKIFTNREIETINKKMKNKKLSQTDSNYLYKFIRPKLKEILIIDAGEMLEKMEYNQKISMIENKIRKVIIGNIENVDSIAIYGSAIQNNYKNYRDIDILVVTKEKIYHKIKARYNKIKELKNILQKQKINADIQIYDKETVEYNTIHNPTMIYELSDSKIIYGKLKIPTKNREVYKIDLRMKLDSSDVEDTYLNGNDLYKALRNIIAVRLILNRIIDNKLLIDSLDNKIGKSLIQKLKENVETNTERKIALIYLRELLKETKMEMKGDAWERIGL